MKKLLLLLTSLSCIQSFAQPNPAWTWADQGKGSSWEDASAVAANNNNQSYTTGYFSSATCIFGTDTLTTNGMADVYLVKYDMDGSYLWSYNFGGAGDDYGLSITCDQMQNIIMVGNFSSPSIVFGNDTLINAGVGTPDMFIVKFDPNGNVLWARREGCADYDNCASVAVDLITHDIYVAGAFYNADIVVGSDTIVNHTMYDMILMKFDVNGNNLWARGAGGNYNDLANAVCVDFGGQIYISGGFASDTLALPNDTLVNAFGSMPDIFIARYDVNGNEIWARRYGSNDNDHAVAIASNTFGGVVAAGHYHSASFTVGNDTLTNMGEGDVWVIRLDSMGNVSWGQTFGGDEHDFGHTVIVDGQGDVYVAGMFMSMSMMVGFDMLMNASMDEDMFLARFNINGSPVWATSVGGPGRDYINCLSFSMAYSIFVAGSFSSPSVTIGPDVLTNTGSASTGEAFTARLDFSIDVAENSNENEISVYPNPGSGVFNFVNPKNENVRVEIFNAIGQQVYVSENNSASTFSVDLSDEPAGIYFVKMVTAEDVQSTTLILE